MYSNYSGICQEAKMELSSVYPLREKNEWKPHQVRLGNERLNELIEHGVMQLAKNKRKMLQPGSSNSYDQNIWRQPLVHFFLIFGGHESFLWGHWYPFWTSDDVSPGFQSQGGSLTCMLCHLCALNSWHSPLVWHLLTL